MLVLAQVVQSSPAVNNTVIILGAVSAFITASALAYSTFRTARGIRSIMGDVKTVNGRSLGTLAELDEGRRIRKYIPAAEQTTREKAYVSLLEKTEREGSMHEVAEDVKLAEKGRPSEGPTSTLRGG